MPLLTISDATSLNEFARGAPFGQIVEKPETDLAEQVDH